MRICEVDGCVKKHYAKGCCYSHYAKLKFNQVASLKKRLSDPSRVKCSVGGCDKPYYARGLCQNHHSIFLRTGDTISQRERNRENRCCVKWCNKKAIVDGGMCSHHIKKIKKYGVLLKNYRAISHTGANNYNWKGGCASYKNHSEFKRQRLKVLKASKGLCVKCGEKATSVHHIDKSKHNHKIENLLPLCSKCHWVFHTGVSKGTTKYKRLYGYTMYDIQKKINKSLTTICKLHKVGALKDFLKAS